METKFNFNSQVCTDKNQSERLLALGLKPETADMHYWKGISGTWYPDAKPWDEAEENDIPAWSLHRLIEMMPTDIIDYRLGVSFNRIAYYLAEGLNELDHMFLKNGNLYDCIIDCIEWLIKEGILTKIIWYDTKRRNRKRSDQLHQ